MAAFLYASFPLNAMGGDSAGEGPMDLLSDTIKAALLDGHTSDQTGDAVWSDVSGDETSGSGYTAGGITLANKTWTVSSLTSTFDNTADLVWTTATFDADHLVLYDDTPTSPADPLIMYDSFGSQSVSGADFTYSVNASGFFSIAVTEDS